MAKRIRAQQPVTAAQLKELLDYDPLTGVFYWKVMRQGRGARPGALAGTFSAGAVNIMIDGRNYKAHRLAWLFMTGEWPPADIDHRDTNPANNRWKNLRVATQSLNNCNTRRRCDNTTGFKGVTPHQGKFRARIRLHGACTDLGVFDAPELAHAAYCTASAKIHGDFGRTM
jgi:hypothetical protein